MSGGPRDAGVGPEWHPRDTPARLHHRFDLLNANGGHAVNLILGRAAAPAACDDEYELVTRSRLLLVRPQRLAQYLAGKLAHAENRSCHTLGMLRYERARVVLVAAAAAALVILVVWGALPAAIMLLAFVVVWSILGVYGYIEKPPKRKRFWRR